MTYTRTDFHEPVEAPIELLELHIGAVHGLDGQRYVAVMLQAGDKRIQTDPKFGALLNDWVEVVEVIEGLMMQAEISFGKKPDHA